MAVLGGASAHQVVDYKQGLGLLETPIANGQTGHLLD